MSEPTNRAHSQRKVSGSFRPEGWLVAIALGTASLPTGCEAPAELESAPLCSPPSSGSAPMRLLTRFEYDNTIRDLLGDDSRPARTFPPEPEVGGFDNHAESHVANPLLIEQLTATARLLAERAVQNRLDAIAPCDDTQEELACAERFLSTFGKHAYRRPLGAEERDSLLRLFRKAAPTLGYGTAIGLMIEAMLQSPQFLYRVEAPLTPLDDPEPSSVALGPYELASRLSYFLWGSMPDDELFAAAEEGRLGTPQEIEAQARRLLADPRAQQQVTRFHERWLGLKRFETVERNVEDPRANASWRKSVLSFVDEVFWSESGTVADLFRSPVVYVDEVIGPLYGHPQTPDAGLVPVELEEERAGLLTQPGLMAMLAHSNQSSPIQRGVFIRERILCTPVPAPPPTVNNTPPDPDPNATTRERFAVHTEDSGCASCHRLIDPIGFGFESFDQLGRYRETENGAPIDTSGELFMSPDPELDGPFDGAAELSERLAESPVVVECLARYWNRFALGRMDTAEDSCIAEQVSRSVQRAGGRLEELLIAIVRSEAFRYRPRWPEERP